MGDINAQTIKQKTTVLNSQNAKTMKKIIISTVAFACIATDYYSQDLQAGEINVKNISGLTYEGTIYLYQNISTLVNRPNIIINWGDGGLDTLLFETTGCGDTNTTTKKCVGTHTYPGTGTYIISCVDSFRLVNIQNISNSINEKMFLQYQLIINPFIGVNSSPISLNCAHDFWQCCNWVYNSGSFDNDGDSLAYKLVQPFTTNYTFPPASVDSVTGDMTFNPTEVGLYSFCMKIEEWRKISSNYYLIGSTYRQMQIDVYILTAVNENNYRQTISLFPNPFCMHTVLQSEHSLNNATLTVDNCFGQTIKQIKNISGQTITLQRDNLPSGLYFLQLKQDSKVIATNKLVITD